VEPLQLWKAAFILFDIFFCYKLIAGTTVRHHLWSNSRLSGLLDKRERRRSLRKTSPQAQKLA
jgi:hypothetical protein